MTQPVLSVNVNKIAWLRNARDGNVPNLLLCCEQIINAGAKSITIHPRPDERHIRTADVYEIAQFLLFEPEVELNIEGNPLEPANLDTDYPGFKELVMDVIPDQVTLVPDANDQLTSDHGWNLSNTKNLKVVRAAVRDFQSKGCRTSIFLDPDLDQCELAAKTKAARIELFTGPWAELVYSNESTNEKSDMLLSEYRDAALKVRELGMQVNAGHDLNLNNLKTFCTTVPVDEVSIGHALVADALDMGLSNAVQAYLQILEEVECV